MQVPLPREKWLTRWDPDRRRGLGAVLSRARTYVRARWTRFRVQRPFPHARMCDETAAVVRHGDEALVREGVAKLSDRGRQVLRAALASIPG